MRTSRDTLREYLDAVAEQARQREAEREPYTPPPGAELRLEDGGVQVWRVPERGVVE